MYEICQNEFRLGAAAPGPTIFLPVANAILM